MSLSRKLAAQRSLPVHVAGLSLAIIVSGACVAQPDTDPTLVKILFEGDCPTSVDPSEPVSLSRVAQQRIAWQAVDKATGEDIEVEFDIYYNPFVGGNSNRHTKKGYIKSTPVANDVPVNVEYKYTIVARKCEQAPLDPRIITKN